jgi:hypothetical protein
VNRPDYEGPTAAFGASVQAGHATLDALRTVLNFGELTGSDRVLLALWENSGGSIATEATAELQVQYAPELDIQEAVCGGLVADFSADFDLFNMGAISGDLVAALLSVTAQYPDARIYLESCLKPENAGDFLAARHEVTSVVTSFFAFKNVYDYFKGGGEDLQAAVLRKCQSLCIRPFLTNTVP